MKYLLDTNVFREVGKQQPHVNVRAWLDTVDDADLAISALTVREVTKGVIRLRTAKPQVAAAIEARVATIWGRLRIRVKSGHTGIGGAEPHLKQWLGAMAR